MRKPDPIELANANVDIVSVCQMVGMDVSGDVTVGRSRKVRCPFGPWYHSDSGVDPAMRIYPDSNSAYCFSCATYYTPVTLAARAWDTTRRVAALRLLDAIGYRPFDLRAAWHRAQQYEPEPDRSLLADALKTYCRRIDSGWSACQFDPAVATMLVRCLSLLDLVTTGAEATLWLDGCKRAMRTVLQPD